MRQALYFDDGPLPDQVSVELSSNPSRQQEERKDENSEAADASRLESLCRNEESKGGSDRSQSIKSQEPHAFDSRRQLQLRGSRQNKSKPNNTEQENSLLVDEFMELEEQKEKPNNSQVSNS